MVTIRLLLAHMIGDYALQTGEIARLKAKGWQGLFVHFCIVTAASGLLVAGKFPYWWAWTLLLGIIHILVDQYRTFRLKDLRPVLSLPYLLFDQGLHLITIFAIAGIGAGESVQDVWLSLNGMPREDDLWCVLTIFAIILIWTTAVLEMSVLRTFHRPYRISPPVNIEPLDRLLGAGERLVGTALLLTPYPFLYPLAFIPRLYWGLRHSPERLPPSVYGTRAVISALVALGVGLLLRRMRIEIL
jgi:hypothetical protein